MKLKLLAFLMLLPFSNVSLSETGYLALRGYVPASASSEASIIGTDFFQSRLDLDFQANSDSSEYKITVERFKHSKSSKKSPYRTIASFKGRKHFSRNLNSPVRGKSIQVTIWAN